jgi:hypothetical protein
MVLLPGCKCCGKLICEVCCPDIGKTQLLIDYVYPGGGGLKCTYLNVPQGERRDVEIECPGSESNETVVIDLDTIEAMQAPGQGLPYPGLLNKRCEIRVTRSATSKLVPGYDCPQLRDGVLDEILGGTAVLNLCANRQAYFDCRAVANGGGLEYSNRTESSWGPQGIDYEITWRTVVRRQRYQYTEVAERPSLSARYDKAAQGFGVAVEPVYGPGPVIGGLQYYTVTAIRILDPGWAVDINDRISITYGPEVTEVNPEVGTVTTTNYNILGAGRLVSAVNGSGTGAVVTLSARTNAAPWQGISRFVINSPGSGYTVGDPISITLVATDLILEVDRPTAFVSAVNAAGGVTAITVSDGGRYTGRRLASVVWPANPQNAYLSTVPGPPADGQPGCAVADSWPIESDDGLGFPIGSSVLTYNSPVCTVNVGSLTQERVFRVCELPTMSIRLE